MREYFHETQQQVLFTPAKDIVLCAGRGWGKGLLVKRELVPAGSTLTPVSIEELFVLMVKGENVR